MRIYFLISLLSAGFLMGTSAYAQVNKCTVDGQVIYQSEPCVGKGVSGKELKIQNTAVSVPTPSPSKASPPSEKPAPTPPVLANSEPAPTARLSPLEREAELCLQYVRENLHDPKSAYYSSPSKESRKLSMTVHAKNKLGGIVASQAECEINGGVLDKSWTNIHMKRLGWNERSDQLGEKIQ
jgi:hypothetical protein